MGKVVDLTSPRTTISLEDHLFPDPRELNLEAQMDCGLCWNPLLYAGV